MTNRYYPQRARGASRLRFLRAAPSALVPLPGGTKAL